MSGYIGSTPVVTQVDGYNRTEADAEFVDVTGDTVTGSLTVDQDLTVDTDTLHVDSASNRVGIGTSSPSALLHVADESGSATVNIQASDTGTSRVNFGDTTDIDVASIRYAHSINDLIFTINASEAMRIDSNGNLLVGKSVVSATTPGIVLHHQHYILATRDNGVCAFFNRETGDGDILKFRKDNVSVGEIGSVNGVADLYIGTGNVGLRFGSGIDQIVPYDPSSNNNRDNAIDLGRSTIRFDDVYATNGTIQTSDANEKQDIRGLTDAEISAAQELASQGVVYRWIKSVEEKDEEARLHTGQIAQDVKATMEKHGLDAGRYAFFIYSEWTDEETGEEKSRMGLRYAELQSFIQAGMSARVEAIEARLDQLEA